MRIALTALFVCLVSSAATAQESVSFATQGGGLVHGLLFGKGERAVSSRTVASSTRKVGIANVAHLLRLNSARCPSTSTATASPAVPRMPPETTITGGSTSSLLFTIFG